MRRNTNFSLFKGTSGTLALAGETKREKRNKWVEHILMNSPLYLTKVAFLVRTHFANITAPFLECPQTSTSLSWRWRIASGVFTTARWMAGRCQASKLPHIVQAPWRVSSVKSSRVSQWAVVKVDELVLNWYVTGLPTLVVSPASLPIPLEPSQRITVVGCRCRDHDGTTK